MKASAKKPDAASSIPRELRGKPVKIESSWLSSDQPQGKTFSKCRILDEGFFCDQTPETATESPVTLQELDLYSEENKVCLQRGNLRSCGTLYFASQTVGTRIEKYFASNRLNETHIPTSSRIRSQELKALDGCRLTSARDLDCSPLEEMTIADFAAVTLLSPSEIVKGSDPENGNRSFQCVIDRRKIHCWGDLIDNRSFEPPSGLIDPYGLVAGNHHACVIDQGQPVCWGINDLPYVKIPGTFKNARQLFLERDLTCVLDDHGVRCWRASPEPWVAFPTAKVQIKKFVSVPSKLGCEFCYIGRDDSFDCTQYVSKEFRSWPQASLPEAPPCEKFVDGHRVCAPQERIRLSWMNSGELPNQITAGYFHLCTLKDGRVSCFGNNDLGQTQVPSDLGSVLQITAGAYHTCALTSEYQVRCWGDKKSGVILEQPNLIRPIQIVSSPVHVCALEESGIATCWGKRSYKLESDSKEPIQKIFLNTPEYFVRTASYSGDLTSFKAPAGSPLILRDSFVCADLGKDNWTCKAPEQFWDAENQESLQTRMNCQIKVDLGGVHLDCQSLQSFFQIRRGAKDGYFDYTGPSLSIANPVYLRLATELPFQGLQNLSKDFSDLARRMNPLRASLLKSFATLASKEKDPSNLGALLDGAGPLILSYDSVSTRSSLLWYQNALKNLSRSRERSPRVSFLMLQKTLDAISSVLPQTERARIEITQKLIKAAEAKGFQGPATTAARTAIKESLPALENLKRSPRTGFLHEMFVLNLERLESIP